MRVSVIAFATASDVLGKQAVEVELPEGSRLSDLRDVLTGRYPDLEPIWPRLAIAVGGQLGGAERELEDGVEVALLPPVSGGSEVAGAVAEAARAELVDAPIDVGEVERRVASPRCGAVVLFLGTVRDHHRGRGVAWLTYSAYRPMAREVLERITTELEEETDVDVAIVHRLGDVPVGEPSVVIAAASPHRQAAYEASRTALERLKREVPIWKREHYADGEVAWREEEPLVASGLAESGGA